MNAVTENISAAPVALSAFVTVPATTLPGGHVEPAFQVGRYLCSKGADGQAVIDAALTPWVRINYAEARAAAAAAGFALITERQALAIAINIAGVAVNWTGGAVGEGSLFQGLRSGEFSGAQAGDVVPADADEQRWFELSNGERICDAAGNAYSWVFDNVQGDSDGLVARAFAADSPSITAAPYPSLERGVGWYPRAGADWAGLRSSGAATGATRSTPACSVSSALGPTSAAAMSGSAAPNPIRVSDPGFLVSATA